jgi:hypothetical protein
MVRQVLSMGGRPFPSTVAPGLFGPAVSRLPSSLSAAYAQEIAVRISVGGNTDARARSTPRDG